MYVILEEGWAAADLIRKSKKLQAKSDFFTKPMTKMTELTA